MANPVKLILCDDIGNLIPVDSCVIHSNTPFKIIFVGVTVYVLPYCSLFFPFFPKMRILAHFSVHSNLPETTGFFEVLVQKTQCLCGFVPRTKLSETNTKLTDPDTHFIKLEIMMPPEGQGFESLRLRHKKHRSSVRITVFFCSISIVWGNPKNSNI